MLRLALLLPLLLLQGALVATAVDPLPARTPAPSLAPKAAGLMEKLYELIWPAGRFRGNLAEAVARTTEKGGGATGATELLLVNAEKHTFQTWEGGANAVEPVVSHDGRRLFFRRGKSLWQQGMEIGKERPRIVGKPEQIARIAVRRLYACVPVDGALHLCAETDEGQIRLLQCDRKPAAWVDLPTDDRFTQNGPRPTAEILHQMRALRPDGLQAWVRDHKLVGQHGEGAPIETLAPISAAGVPAWLGNTKWLLVSARAEDEP